MQQLNEFLKTANYQPVFDVSVALAGLTACAIVVILLLHTLHLLGRRTPLYRHHKPVSDWSRRFYPVSASMIIFLLMLMWLLNVWSHQFTRAE